MLSEVSKAEQDAGSYLEQISRYVCVFSSTYVHSTKNSCMPPLKATLP